MSAAAKTAETQSDGALTHKQIMTILTGLLLGMFLAALDQNIVSTAIRRIGDDLNGLSVQAWVTTAFLITSTITTPLYGKLSDIYGRKPFFLLAISIFISGSAMCGLATNMYMLAAFRAFQGLGAGGLFTLALAIMADIVSPQQRARYMGYFMAVFATSSVLGPVVGGFLSGQNSIFGITGWRWIFWVNVPIGFVALVVVNRVLRLPPRRQDHSIDWQGALALIVGVVPLLVVAEQGRVWGWSSVDAWACYVLGAVGVVAFVLIERRMGDDALIPMRLFDNRPFATGAAQCFVIGVGMFGGLSCIPLYLQIVKGASPTKAGLLVLPMVVGMMSASMVVGQLTARTGRYKRFPIIGCTLMIIAAALLATVGADTPLWQTDIFMLTFGAGLGMNMQTIQLAMQNSVSPRDIGVATSSGTFFRQMGGTLGVAVLLSVLFSSAPGKIASEYDKAGATAAFQQAAKAHPDQLATLRSGSSTLNDTSFLQNLDRVLAHPFLVGFSNAMDTVFLTVVGIMVVALALSVSMKEVPLRRVSGMQAARAEADAADAAGAAGAAGVGGVGGAQAGAFEPESAAERFEEIAEAAATAAPGGPRTPSEAEIPR